MQRRWMQMLAPEANRHVNRKRHLFWLLPLGLLLVAGGLIGALWPHERLLLSRATRVGRLDTFFVRNEDTHWLTEREVAGFTFEKVVQRVDAHTVLRREAPHVTLRDLRTQTTQPLTALDNALRDGLTICNSYVCRVAPDGKQMLWVDAWDSKDPLPSSYFVTTRDRLLPTRWPRDRHESEDRVAWLPDSSAWVHFCNRNARYGEAEIYSPDARQPLRIVRLPSQAFQYGVIFLGVTRDLCALTIGDLSMLSMAVPNAPMNSAAITFTAYDLSGAHAPPRAYRVQGPRGAEISQILLSPRGDRLAWVCDFVKEPSLPGPMRWLLDLMGRRSVSQSGLWVSRLDGSDLHEIGHINVSAPSQIMPSPSLVPSQGTANTLILSKTPGDMLGNIVWTPDGTRLHFSHDQDIYTVPVD